MRLKLFAIAALIAPLCPPAFAADGENPVFTPPRADGYRGIWYSNQPSDDQYRYKYSGGLGTYCAKHIPHFQYAHEVNKTFFVYGGTKGAGEADPLLIMSSYYDHNNGTVPRPAILMEKGTGDAHHNPVLSIDANGFLWVFASAHGGKDGYLFKSAEPYSIERWERVMQREFTYPQPWWFDGFGFVFHFTKYTAGRELYVSLSRDGREWTPDRKLAGFGGHYQLSRPNGNSISTAFNWHPPQGGLNARTNLYYARSDDFGQTWTTIAGEPLELPLDRPDNKALTHNFQEDGHLVYLKDINHDANGNPAILAVLSRGYEPGPENGPRYFTIVRWTGDEWERLRVAETDHNYDTGSLFIEPDGTWRVLAPTAPGAQPYCTGGDIVLWESGDGGKSWDRTRQLTADPLRNHTYARRARVSHPDFYAFWADGDALKPSDSSLYYTNIKADTVFRLPERMEGEAEAPAAVTDWKR